MIATRPTSGGPYGGVRRNCTRLLRVFYDYDVVVAGAGPAGSTAASALARRGYSVLLADKKQFPRDKICASWVNRLAFDRFDYLKNHLDSLVEAPFRGIIFTTPDLAGRASAGDRRVSGYLTLRRKFDDGLRRLAEQHGAKFRGGCAVTSLEQERDGVRVGFSTGEQVRARVLVGADGGNSRVAVLSGLRKRGWSPPEYVVCANEDIPADPALIRRSYQPDLPLIVAPRFAGVAGYGWIFAKREHVCVGIGGRLPRGMGIREVFSRFVEESKRAGLLPPELYPRRTDYGLDPAGAVSRGGALVRGRVVLVGDAGGFVSGSTGEGIYPGMVSADGAAAVIHRALMGPSVESGLARFETEWRQELGEYIRPLPGGEKEGQTHDRLNLIFRHRFLARVAARAFLYGEPVSWRTLLRACGM